MATLTATLRALVQARMSVLRRGVMPMPLKGALVPVQGQGRVPVRFLRRRKGRSQSLYLAACSHWHWHWRMTPSVAQV